MKIMYRRLFISTFLIISFCQTRVIAQPDVKSEIGNTDIRIGEQTYLAISAETKTGSTIEFPTYDSLQTIIPGIEVVSQRDTTVILENGEKHIRKYLITSFDTAEYTIPPLRVKVDEEAYETKELPLKVLSMEIDTAHVDKICDLKPAMEPAFDIHEWTVPIVLAILTFIVSIILTYIIIRIKDNRPIIRRFRFSPYIPPHKTAMNEIEKLRSEENLQEDNSKTYYTRLTDILRKYMQGRYGFNAMEMTTDEIIHELKEVNDQDAIKELHELFITADLVKFAKAKPELSENDKNLLNAITYIQNTKKEEVVEQQTSKEVVVEDVRSKKTKKILYTGITIVSIILVFIVIYLIQHILILKY